MATPDEKRWIVIGISVGIITRTYLKSEHSIISNSVLAGDWLEKLSHPMSSKVVASIRLLLALLIGCISAPYRTQAVVKTRTEAHCCLTVTCRSAKSGGPKSAKVWAALFLPPDPAEAQFLWHPTRVHVGQPERAGETLGGGQTISSDAAQTHNSSGLAFQQQGYLADAAAEFRRALEVQPDFAEARNNLGMTLLAEGDTQGAVEEFRRALKTNPQYSIAINSLGLAFLEMGRWDEAITQYQALIKLDPKIPEAYYNLGEALKHDEDFEGAAEALGKSLQLDPTFPEAHCALGEVLWQQGKLDEAVTELRAAVSTRSDFLPAYLILGNLLQQKGDLSGALAVLQQVLRFAPQNGPAYEALGIVLKQKGDIDGAAAAFGKAQALKEVDLTLQAATQATMTGALLRRRGNVAGSIEKLRFAIRLAPNLALAHYQLGLALQEKHDDAQAAVEFGKASQLDPRLRPPRA